MLARKSIGALRPDHTQLLHRPPGPRGTGTAWRRPFCVNAAATRTEPAENEKHISWTRAFVAAVEPHSSAGAYVNFLGEESEERVRSSYRENLARLYTLKNKYDPTNVFHFNQNIRPSRTGD